MDNQTVDLISKCIETIKERENFLGGASDYKNGSPGAHITPEVSFHCIGGLDGRCKLTREEIEYLVESSKKKIESLKETITLACEKNVRS